MLRYIFCAIIGLAGLTACVEEPARESGDPAPAALELERTPARPVAEAAAAGEQTSGNPESAEPDGEPAGEPVSAFEVDGVTLGQTLVEVREHIAGSAEAAITADDINDEGTGGLLLSGSGEYYEFELGVLTAYSRSYPESSLEQYRTEFEKYSALYGPPNQRMSALPVDAAELSPDIAAADLNSFWLAADGTQLLDIGYIKQEARFFVLLKTLEE